MAGDYVKLLLLFAFMFSFTISDEYCSRRLVGGKWITRGDCGNTVSTEATVLKELKGSIPCRERKAPRNGAMNGTKTQYMPGDVISFKCNVGYRLKGKSEDTCQPRGIWANNKTPTCVLITCGERLAPPSGSIEGLKTRYLPGDRIKFTCKKLYKLGGTEADTCKDDGSWDVDVTPKCIRITCPQRSAPTNGELGGKENRYYPGRQIWFTCDRYYRMVGANMDTCQENGSWEVNATPKCVQVTCPQRSAPANGTIVGKLRYLPGHNVTYACDRLYRVEGAARDTCQEDGSWKVGNTPKCVLITCPPRQSPVRGAILTAEPYFPGRHIEFTCYLMYKMVGNAIDNCSNDGSWKINVTPKCVQITCPKPEAPTNGGIARTRSQYVPFNVIRFTCNPKYAMEGSSVDTCQRNGSWARGTPKCIRITCPQREAPIGGGIAGQANQYLPGDVITFTCGNFSAILEGAQRDFCLSDGSWRYKATPKCTVTSFLCAASSGLYYRKKCYTIPSHVPAQFRVNSSGSAAQCSKTGSSLVEMFDQAHQKTLSDFILTKLPFGTSKYNVDVWTAMAYESWTNTIVYRSGQTAERSTLSWKTGYPRSLSRSSYLLLKVSSKSSGYSPGIWNFQHRYTANAILCEK